MKLYQAIATAKATGKEYKCGIPTGDKKLAYAMMYQWKKANGTNNYTYKVIER